MQLTPVATIYCVSYLWSAADYRLSGHGINEHRLLNEVEEQLTA